MTRLWQKEENKRKEKGKGGDCGKKKNKKVRIRELPTRLHSPFFEQGSMELYLNKNKIKKSEFIDNKILTFLRSRRIFFYNQKRIGKLYGDKLYANFKLASFTFLLLVSSLLIIIAF